MLVTDSVSTPNYQAVANAGFAACSRYLRNITKQEVQSIWNAGLGVILNDELGPGNEALQGKQGGENAANRAIATAISLGWTGNDSPIIYSGTDFDVQPSQYAICDEYYQQIASKGYPWGIYGPWHYIEHAHSWTPIGTTYWASAGWQTGQNPIPNMQQDLKQLNFGVTVDVNTVITNLDVWSGLGVANTMAYFRHDSAGTVYELAQGYKWHCSAAYFYNGLGGALYPNPKGLPDSPWSYQIADGDFAVIPDGPIPTNGTGAPTKFTLTMSGEANAEN